LPASSHAERSHPERRRHERHRHGDPAGEEVSEGCPDTYGSDLGAFALPGLKAGETAPIFAGGSNVAVATKSDSPEMAKAALTIMLSEGYQKLLAEQGLTPGIKSAAQFLPDTPIAKAQAEALANSKFTPTSPNWAEVEAAQIIPDALVKIAQGGDVAAIAAELDTAIEAILNK
jgi:N,N'-diacetylchitobiose transport system substrate-binding protein